MKHRAEIRMDGEVLKISGDLDFNNVMSIYKKSLDYFSSALQTLTMDFSGLHTTNSAALALIIDWMRLAKKQNKSIQFSHLSHDIISLEKASGLDKIISHVRSF